MLIKLEVHPESKEERIKSEAENSLEIWVREKAESGNANGRVLELVRDYYKITSGMVRIVSGHHAPHKIIDIPDQFYR